jgi:ABC-type enterobactin transport system permease subunit
MKQLYLLLAVLGIILPYSQFALWSMDNGSALGPMLQAMFANPIASGIALDAIMAGVATVVLVIVDGRKQRVAHLWLPLVGISLCGVGFALPCYLYLRERVVSERHS